MYFIDPLTLRDGGKHARLEGKLFCGGLRWKSEEMHVSHTEILSTSHVGVWRRLNNDDSEQHKANDGVLNQGQLAHCLQAHILSSVNTRT
jgi:hypothetical protein